MSVFLRQNRAVIRFSGDDAERLLNDVLTADIKAKDDLVRWWSLLSPQGKIQAEGLISYNENAFWLDVATDLADSFIKRMRLYKLRAKVEIEDLRDNHSVGWTAVLSGDGIISKDPRHAEMGFRVIAPKADSSDWVADDTPCVVHRIDQGICELGDDFDADSQFPHDIGMDLLAGVDFDKGCYIGQEVVSRMQHRGTARRRPVIVSDVEAASGSELMCADKQAGTLGRVVNGKTVALVRLDRVTDPTKASVDGKPVHLALPDWASYDFADSSDKSE